MQLRQVRQLAALWLILAVCQAPAIPAAQPTSRDTAGDSTDAYAQRVEQLKKRVSPEEFTFVVVPPFVVAGDESPQEVQRRARDTVKWAVDKLKASYFDKEPSRIIDVWLFRDKESYRDHALKLFGDTPDTPYGYYSSKHRALVMNISTGGGTLVHEIVHPFVAADFPKCPAWFNEGLASLYEQCGEVGGKIHGYTNWRLHGLQEAIRDQKLPAFKALCSTSSGDFYERDRGVNYAQARYLCYYLQQQGLLEKFYKEFRASAAAHRDRSGYSTLQKILKQDDMAAFQRDWEAFVLKLKFPEEGE